MKVVFIAMLMIDIGIYLVWNITANAKSERWFSFVMGVVLSMVALYATIQP